MAQFMVGWVAREDGIATEDGEHHYASDPLEADTVTEALDEWEELFRDYIWPHGRGRAGTKEIACSGHKRRKQKALQYTAGSTMLNTAAMTADLKE